MEWFRISRDLPFMRFVKMLNSLSLLTFIVALFFLLTQGLHLSVEFTGGSLIELSYQQSADLDKTRKVLVNAGFPDVQVQHFGTTRDVMIRLPLEEKKEVLESKKDTFGELLPASKLGEKIVDLLRKEGIHSELRRAEFVGPQVGKELFFSGGLALLFVLVGVVLYLTIRFEWKLALAAILANCHDIIIILGFFSAFQWEFSLPVLAAVLAVLGYSVNESVIIFDRIRECFKGSSLAVGVSDIINKAITSTISRTLITHGLTQLMVLSMLFFGGESLFYFSLALTIGILCGIYSSVFVACGLVLLFKLKREDLIKNPAAL